MEPTELVSNDEMKKAIPKWLIGFGGSLMFISLFINSIGFNLMSVNTAITDRIVATLEQSEKQTEIVSVYTTELLERIKILETEVQQLKVDSHPPKNKGD